MSILTLPTLNGGSTAGTTTCTFCTQYINTLSRSLTRISTMCPACNPHTNPTTFRTSHNPTVCPYHQPIPNTIPTSEPLARPTPNAPRPSPQSTTAQTILNSSAVPPLPVEFLESLQMCGQGQGCTLIPRASRAPWPQHRLMARWDKRPLAVRWVVWVSWGQAEGQYRNVPWVKSFVDPPVRVKCK